MFEAIQMDPSVTNKGVPNEIGRKLIKPEITKDYYLVPSTISEMFDDDYLSLLAVNMYKKFPMNTEVWVAKFIQDGERVCVGSVDGKVTYYSFGEKIFKDYQ